MVRKVKWAASDRAGAPVLSGTKGALPALLNAVLVTGYNIKSVTGATAASGAVTLPVGSGHGFAKDDVVLVEGATGVYAALNAEFDVISTDAISVTVSASVPDGAVTGSITVKFAPLGWESPFSRTNVCTYRSKNLTSSRAVLRVDHDTNERNVIVTGYESMSSINTGVNQFPSVAQLGSDSYRWPVSDTANTSSRRWQIIGDDKTFYLILAPARTASSPTTAQFGVGFGDIEDWRPGSVFSAWISGSKGPVATMAFDLYNFAMPVYASFHNYLQRDYTGVTPSTLAAATVPGALIADMAIGRNIAPDGVASRVDGGITAAPALVVEAGNLIRGKYRGLYWPYVGGQGTTDYIITPTVGDPAGRMLLIGGDTAYGQFCCLFDLKGAWA